MKADYVLDYDSLTPNQAHKLYLMARFSTGPAPNHQSRRPLNLGLVIDRSGSMAGQKLSYTIQAAQFLVQNLSNADILSIVLYNDHIETLLTPEHVTRKDAINQQIATIKASGTTNLSSGWLEGCKLVDQNRSAGFLNRVILMSDGLANRGVTDPAQLILMAQQKRQKGVSTTTMGLGTDFNEDLLMDMANAGGGAFYFIESPEVTPTIFQEELQGLLNVVGQNLSVSVRPARGVTVDDQLNAYPMNHDDAFMTFRMGDIFAEEIKALVLEIGVPAQPSTGKLKLADLRFEYDELTANGSEHRIVNIPVEITVGEAGGLPALPDPDVNRSVLLLKAAKARRLAVRAADRGDFNTAAHLLRSAASAIEQSNDDDAHLLEEKSALAHQATEIEQGASRYNVYSRKTMSTQAYYTMTSRHEDTMMLRVREAKKRQTQEVPHLEKPGQGEKSPPPAEQDLRVQQRMGVTPTHVTWNGKMFHLTGDVIRIGRSRHNEIVIEARGVSRFHCHIKRQDGNLVIEDLGSTNGTMLDGVAIKSPRILSVGDVAYLCDEKLTFHDQPGHTAAYTVE
ncbi:MAG: VWA domain-containing protein [Chloroflexota bacterium]